MNDLRYDHAVAAAVLVLETFDTSPGAPKKELLSTVVFIVLEAMQRYESETSRNLDPSTN